MLVGTHWNCHTSRGNNHIYNVDSNKTSLTIPSLPDTSFCLMITQSYYLDVQMELQVASASIKCTSLVAIEFNVNKTATLNLPLMTLPVSMTFLAAMCALKSQLTFVLSNCLLLLMLLQLLEELQPHCVISTRRSFVHLLSIFLKESSGLHAKFFPQNGSEPCKIGLRLS